MRDAAECVRVVVVIVNTSCRLCNSTVNSKVLVTCSRVASVKMSLC